MLMEDTRYEKFWSAPRGSTSRTVDKAQLYPRVKMTCMLLSLQGFIRFLWFIGAAVCSYWSSWDCRPSSCSLSAIWKTEISDSHCLGTSTMTMVIFDLVAGQLCTCNSPNGQLAESEVIAPTSRVTHLSLSDLLMTACDPF